MELRYDNDGELDEVVGRGVDVHLERMDHDSWCLIVTERGRGVWLSIFRKGREVLANVYEDARG